MKYLAAAIQMDTQDHWETNLKQAEQFIAEAAERGAKLVSLPEVFSIIEEKTRYAENIPDGKTTQFLKNLAKKHSIFLHGGSFPESIAGSEKFYNSSLFIDPRGEIIAHYRKIHLFDVDLTQNSYRESRYFEAGEEVVSVSTELGDIGLSICYDLRFPELYRALMKNPLDVLMIPANFTLHTGMDHWESLLRARAIENSCYVIAAAQEGVKPGNLPSYGNSMIIDPWGVVLARGAAPGVVMAEIDLKRVEEVRRRIPSLKNRRSDSFYQKNNR